MRSEAQSPKRKPARRGEALFLWERAFHQGMVSLYEGAFFTGFALALGATTFHIGLLSAAQFLGGVGQLFTEPLLRWAGSRKRYCLIALGISRFLRLGVILLPYLALAGLRGDPLLHLLFLLRLTMSASGASGEIVRLSWVTQVVPRPRRGAFLSLQNMVAGLVKLPAAFLAALFLDHWRARHPESLLGFQVLFGLGLLFGWIAWGILRRVEEWGEPLAEAHEAFWKRIRRPLQHPRFRSYLLYRLSWIFAIGFAADFFDLYMLRFLGMKYVWITLANTFGDGLSLLTAPLWGRWIDHHGAKPVLLLSSLAKALFPLLWALIMPQWWWLVFLVVTLRAFNSASETSMLHLSLHLPPPQEREAFLAVERSLTHPVRALAPLAAGSMARFLNSWQWQTGPFRFEGLHLLFGLSSLLRLGASSLLTRVEEPGARPLLLLLRKGLRRRRRG